MGMAAPILRGSRRTSFDVICAGEPRWRTAKAALGHSAPVTAGLLNVARMLATRPIRIGLAAVLEDDRLARTSLAEIAAQRRRAVAGIESFADRETGPSA
jgi:hypothetical protein